MLARISSPTCRRTTVVVFVILMLAASAFAGGPSEQVLYSFQYSTGDQPYAGLVADKGGNFYGMTAWGGVNFDGSVFELSPPATAGGAWTGAVLYSFLGGDNDGAQPYGGLILDRQGNLYGATHAGGSNNNGAIFELSPPATKGGAWTETVLFLFPTDGSQGTWPMGTLSMDATGNLYGTTWYGGSGSGLYCPVGGCGVVFELMRPASQGGSWRMNVLHNFGAVSGDGDEAGLALVLQSGAIYGTAQSGGANGCGVIFQLVQQNETWIENILHTFVCSDGAQAVAGMIVDSAGNFYGTGRSGGSTNNGVVFELSPPAVSGDPWQETTLYSFTGHYDGGLPYGGVIRDSKGNLYGTASGGGFNNNQSRNNGTVFRLSPPTVSGRAWKEGVLHAFTGATSGDGAEPLGNLLLYKGAFYGTTLGGGSPGPGTVFSVVP